MFDKLKFWDISSRDIVTEFSFVIIHSGLSKFIHTYLTSDIEYDSTEPVISSFIVQYTKFHFICVV